MKTSKLIGPALNWAVEFIEGGCKTEPHANYWLEKWVDPERRYLCESASTCWSHGGPIIEREKITIAYLKINEVIQWEARYFDDKGRFRSMEYGTTPLIAAMRCYVANKLGEEVDIPKELQ